MAPCANVGPFKINQMDKNTCPKVNLIGESNVECGNQVQSDLSNSHTLTIKGTLLFIDDCLCGLIMSHDETKKEIVITRIAHNRYMHGQKQTIGY